MFYLSDHLDARTLGLPATGAMRHELMAGMERDWRFLTVAPAATVISTRALGPAALTA